MRQAFTASHVPPEKWKDANLRPNDKFDVYAFGILVCELLTNEPAYGTENLLSMRNTIFRQAVLNSGVGLSYQYICIY